MRSPLPYFPVVTTGWDCSARCPRDAKLPWSKSGYPFTLLITNSTPEKFEMLLRDAKKYVENVKYGPHYRQGMDVWLPKDAKGPVPCIVYIHGGAWMDGVRLDSSCRELLTLCRKEGLALATISYRMIPDANDAGIVPPVKAPIDDAIAAVRHILEHASEWKIDPARIGLTGGSAGACSSLIASLSDDNALGIRVACVQSPQTTLACEMQIALNEAARRFERKDLLPYAARMRDWIYGGNPGYACYVTGLGFNCRRRNVFGQFFPSTPSIPGGVAHVLNGEYDLPAGGMALWAIATEERR